MERPLLVFAGQSNMMGAATLPPQEQIMHARTLEYLHKPRRLGAPRGAWRREGFPSGEFSYCDPIAAYGEGASPDAISTLTDYRLNSYFCPSMANLADAAAHRTAPFSSYSEESMIPGTCLAPYVVQGLEEAGLACAYAHIAKGAVSIRHYLEGAAADYFDEKVRDFFTDAAERFPDDDTATRALIWLQGEGDGKRGYAHYRESLAALWSRARRLGFTHFLIVRIGWWGDDGIADVMRAEEDFCNECSEAFMLTRVLSYLGHPELDGARWFKSPVPEERLGCRDSYYGYGNHHINDRGFRLIARQAVPNLIRILYRGLPPVLEDEEVLALLR